MRWKYVCSAWSVSFMKLSSEILHSKCVSIPVNGKWKVVQIVIKMDGKHRRILREQERAKVLAQRDEDQITRERATKEIERDEANILIRSRMEESDRMLCESVKCRSITCRAQGKRHISLLDEKIFTLFSIIRSFDHQTDVYVYSVASRRVLISS